jgi:hypothetical protein
MKFPFGNEKDFNNEILKAKNTGKSNPFMSIISFEKRGDS